MAKFVKDSYSFKLAPESDYKHLIDGLNTGLYDIEVYNNSLDHWVHRTNAVNLGEQPSFYRLVDKMVSISARELAELKANQAPQHATPEEHKDFLNRAIKIKSLSMTTDSIFAIAKDLAKIHGKDLNGYYRIVK